MISDKYAETAEAAQILGASQFTIRRWFKEGRLKGEWVGRTVLFSRKYLEKLVNNPLKQRRQVSIGPYTVTEAVELLGVSRQRIWELINKGRIEDIIRRIEAIDQP